jgi:hypothetical protein
MRNFRVMTAVEQKALMLMGVRHKKTREKQEEYSDPFRREARIVKKVSKARMRKIYPVA